MASPVKYVRLRDGVYQYERRVPRAVCRRPERYAALFGSRPLFRRSLRTKDTAVMFAAANAVHADFEIMVAQALARHVPVPTPPQPVRRQLTETDLALVADRHFHLTAEPFEKLHRLADANPEAAAELERMEYELELDAEAIQQAVRGRAQSGQNDAPVVLPLETARHIAIEQGFDAPEGSQELAMIARAVRVGMERGFERITALASGTVIPTLPTKQAATARPTVTIHEAVDRYLEQRDLPPKTTSEVKLALRTFESVVGNKALDVSCCRFRGHRVRLPAPSSRNPWG